MITMGCGDACPIFPGKRYEDWELDDPAGQGIDAVRPIRDEIRRRIEALIADLLPERGAAVKTSGDVGRSGDPRGSVRAERVCRPVGHGLRRTEVRTSAEPS